MSTVDLRIMEQFLQDLFPKEAMKPVKEVFLGLRTLPVQNTMSFLNQMSGTINENGPEGWAAVNGILIGLSLAHLSRNPDMVRMIEDFVAMKKAKRGENVRDINHFKERRIPKNVPQHP